MMKTGQHKKTFKQTLTAFVLGLSLFITHLTSVQAEVELPNGYYHTNITDLEVKVMGGSVKVDRTWYKGKWHFNRAWNPLKRDIGGCDKIAENSISSDSNFALTNPKSSDFNYISLLVDWNPLLKKGYEYLDNKFSIYAGLFESTLAGTTAGAVGTGSGSTTGNAVQQVFRCEYIRNDVTFAKSNGVFSNRLFPRQIIIKKTNGEIRWEDRNGNWIEYSAAGQILRYGDKNNVQVSFAYDTENRITGVFDHFGTQVLWYEYNATSGKLESIRDHVDPLQARKVQYHYTVDLLTSVTDVRGYTWTYGYDVFGDTVKVVSLASMTDPEGRVTTIEGGLVTQKITNPDGTSITYEYGYDKKGTEYFNRRTYSSGRVLELWFNSDGKLIRRDQNGVTIEKVQIEGRVYTHTNELGHQTIRDYDEWDNLIKITHPDKSFRTYKYDPKYSNILEKTNELGVKTKYDYDINGNRIRMTEAIGLPEQRITEYTPDAYGNTLEVKRLGDAVTEEAITSYTYDNFGNVKTETHSVIATESHTINYDIYDRMGNLLEWRDGRGKVWKQTFDEKGNRTSNTDPLNHTTLYEYDGYGNLIKETNAESNSIQYVYNIKNQLDKVIDPLLSEKRYAYNNLGQSVKFYDEESRSVSAIYDSWGRIIRIQDEVGNSVKVTYGVNKNTNIQQNKIAKINYPTFKRGFEYDNRGRKIKITDTLDTTTQHVDLYDFDVTGNLKRHTDPQLKTTTYEYDNLGRRVKVTYPDSSTNIYYYDNRDNLLAVVNEKQVVIRSYTYDHKNRLKKEIWPTGEVYQYFYNENDHIVRKIDAKGQVTKFQFDDVNRRELVTYYVDVDATIPSKSVSLSYNVLNLLTGYDDSVTSAVYVYDALQRRISEVINYGLFSKNITTEYYKNGLKKTFTYPTGTTITYEYDKSNQVRKINIPNEGTIIYNKYKWTEPTNITYPGGGKRIIGYDSLMRIDKVVAIDPANNITLDYGYNYDKAGNIKNKTTKQGVHNYNYDQRYRLIASDNPVLPDETYTYDIAGNRLTDSTTTDNWQYNNSNQLKAYGNTTLDYDLNGSPVKRTKASVVTNYEYDIENRLSTVKDDSNNIISRYYYDPFGRRLWKEVGGQRLYFMYTDEGLIAEFFNDGTFKQSYTYKPGSSFGSTPLFTQTDNGVMYYQSDRLGTPKKLINKNGTVVWSSEASSFGKTNIDINVVENNLRFPGQYYDAETGLHYNYFRYYDPDSGRYISTDPIGLAGGLNTYDYVGGNPIRSADLLGLFTTCDGHAECQIAIGTGARAASGAVNTVGSACALKAATDISEFSKDTRVIIKKLGAKEDSDEERCKKLANEIDKITNELRKRYWDMYDDPYTLYINARYKRNPQLPERVGTWIGHAEQYVVKQEYLRKLLKAWKELGCDGFDLDYDFNAWNLSRLSPPPRPGVHGK